jgi:hypothetical protein
VTGKPVSIIAAHPDYRTAILPLVAANVNFSMRPLDDLSLAPPDILTADGTVPSLHVRDPGPPVRALMPAHRLRATTGRLFVLESVVSELPPERAWYQRCDVV